MFFKLSELLRDREIDLVHIHTSDTLTTYYVGYLFGWIKKSLCICKDVLFKVKYLFESVKI